MNPVSSQGSLKLKERSRRVGSEKEERADPAGIEDGRRWWPLAMEGGWPLEAEKKKQEIDFPLEPLEGMGPWQHLGLGPAKPMLAICR